MNKLHYTSSLTQKQICNFYAKEDMYVIKTFLSNLNKEFNKTFFFNEDNMLISVDWEKKETLDKNYVLKNYSFENIIDYFSSITELKKEELFHKLQKSKKDIIERLLKEPKQIQLNITTDEIRKMNKGVEVCGDYYVYLYDKRVTKEEKENLLVLMNENYVSNLKEEIELLSYKVKNIDKYIKHLEKEDAEFEKTKIRVEKEHDNVTFIDKKEVYTKEKVLKDLNFLIEIFSKRLKDWFIEKENMKKVFYDLNGSYSTYIDVVESNMFYSIMWWFEGYDKWIKTELKDMSSYKEGIHIWSPVVDSVEMFKEIVEDMKERMKDTKLEKRMKNYYEEDMKEYSKKIQKFNTKNDFDIEDWFYLVLKEDNFLLLEKALTKYIEKRFELSNVKEKSFLLHFALTFYNYNNANY